MRAKYWAKQISRRKLFRALFRPRSHLISPISKLCSKCPAALFCFGERPPDQTTRCKRCNVTQATWFKKQFIFTGIIDTVISGVKRCKRRKPIVVVCVNCMTEEERGMLQKVRNGVNEGIRYPLL